MSGTTPTGRPQQRIPVLPQLGFLTLAVVGLLELLARGTALSRLRFGRALLDVVSPALRHYLTLRAWALANPESAALVAVAVVVLALLLTRALIQLWYNEIAARMQGTKLRPDSVRFPLVEFDILQEIGRRPADEYFVGLSPVPWLERPLRPFRLGYRRVLGHIPWPVRCRPVYATRTERSMHQQVLGRTGSGKTVGALLPLVLQDALNGFGALFMDAKGSDENVLILKAIARLAGREKDFRLLALPAWGEESETAGVFSHRYNMVWVRPRSPTDAGGDVDATATRVFGVLPLGDSVYYNNEAERLFKNLMRLLHGIVDEKGCGYPFNLEDLSICIKGVGSTGPWGEAFAYCLKASTDKAAAGEIRSQIANLEDKAATAFTGIASALDKFRSPILNAYDPDLTFEEALEKNLLVYAQLPSNYLELQAPAVGKVVLADIRQEGSLRQIFRRQRNQTPYCITVDEFYTFADEKVIESLNKLRDANLWYTLAHQSMSDLERVSKEFAKGVVDNTRTRHILSQDNAELCEMAAKACGTHQIIEKSVRMQQGALWTSLLTGDAGVKLVETFRLHPNAIKFLRTFGQGYHYSPSGLRRVCYGMLPKALATDFPLTRKDQSKARGLRLREKFIEPKAAGSAAAA